MSTTPMDTEKSSSFRWASKERSLWSRQEEYSGRRCPGSLNPGHCQNSIYGLLILAGTALVNLWLGKALLRTGKRTRSMAITADGKHILTDVYTSAGVLIGLFLVRQTGWYFLDGAVACVVAANILFIGARLVFESSSRLMHAYDPELLDQISSIIAQHRKPAWIDVHRLRAWRSGEHIYIDFHLILPRDLSLEDAHREVMEIEQLLKTRLPGMGDAMIHAEPCIGPECRICSQEPCVIRMQPLYEQPNWCRKRSPPRLRKMTNAKRTRRKRIREGTSQGRTD